MQSLGNPDIQANKMILLIAESWKSGFSVKEDVDITESRAEVLKPCGSDRKQHSYSPYFYIKRSVIFFRLI